MGRFNTNLSALSVLLNYNAFIRAFVSVSKVPNPFSPSIFHQHRSFFRKQFAFFRSVFHSTSASLPLDRVIVYARERSIKGEVIQWWKVVPVEGFRCTREWRMQQPPSRAILYPHGLGVTQYSEKQRSNRMYFFLASKALMPDAATRNEKSNKVRSTSRFIERNDIFDKFAYPPVLDARDRFSSTIEARLFALVSFSGGF